MPAQVLVASAPGEEALAAKLSTPIRAAGYDPVHEGTLLVGESIVEAASKLLMEDVPVVLCGTVRAMGTGWARRVVNAARRHGHPRVFVVQMEKDADVETVSFDERVALYWRNPEKAAGDLVAALGKYYPLDRRGRAAVTETNLEARYRELTLRACDIIDLANLPEGDRHLATRELELRRLYVALRMHVELRADAPDAEVELRNLEVRRLRCWDEPTNSESTRTKRVSIGERLHSVRRLVVLGDPGAGKSTLLRWVATAYLLRLRDDPDWRDLPDVATLPNELLLPILVRCRDLSGQLAALEDMLLDMLRKNEVPGRDCPVLCRLLISRLQQGTALLLIDGLDELSDPTQRARFAGQIEAIHRAYPNAPVTSLRGSSAIAKWDTEYVPALNI